MVDVSNTDQRFGDIAIEMKLLSTEKLDRAFLVQRCIQKRTLVQMPIGKVLKEMGLLSQDQLETILNTQRGENTSADNGTETSNNTETTIIAGLDLSVSDDRLGAFLMPTGEPLVDASPEKVKTLMEERGIVEGVIDDDALAKYLGDLPLPAEPFQVAWGTPPVAPKPAEIRYLFDIDPLRIGTMKEDGTMDWKNRGDIPEVKAGDLLAEKTGGVPGQPGQSVYGKEIPPPKIKEPQLKNGKGTERTEDRNQIIAKVDGTPKLTADGRITVFTLLPIDGDVGVETGNIDFDGYIEVTGSVTAGYSVKGKALRTKEIQNATIFLEEDLDSDSGIYGSTLEVGGNIKASHIHNCQICMVGDLVVEKEVIGSTIEINGRCFVESGKIIDCTIKAKKGIQVKDVGTEASRPSELVVGIDHKYERDVAAAKSELAELSKQKEEMEASRADMAERLDKVATLIGQVAQEQDAYMVQQRQFEEQLNGPNAVQGEEERGMLTDLLAELVEKAADVEKRIESLMEQDDEIRVQLDNITKTIGSSDEKSQAVQEQLSILEENLKVDPGLPIIKVSGTVHAKTKISGPHKKMILPEKKHSVRIAESKSESGGKWELTISSLR